VIALARFLSTIMIIASGCICLGSVAIGQTPSSVLQGIPSGGIAGMFHQAKRIPGLPQPLLTEGHFLLKPGTGVVWRTTRPSDIAVVLTDTVVVDLSGKKVVSRRRIEDLTISPLVAGLVDMIEQPDWTEIEEMFSVSWSAGSGDWKLTLRPRTSPLVDILTEIRMKGGTFINQIILKGMGEEETSIEFSQQQLLKASVLPPAMREAAEMLNAASN
jgi:hypothetical protein